MIEHQVTCKICLGEVKQEVKYDLNEDLVTQFSSEDVISITEHPTACNKCKVEIDETHQPSMENEAVFQLHPYLVKNEIKEEFVEDSKTEAIVALINTDLPMCIEDSTATNILHCYQCNYSTNDKQNLTDHIFTHRVVSSMLITHVDTATELLNGEEKYIPEFDKTLFECHDCHYKTNSKITLKLHIRNCLNGEKSLDQVNKCEKCNLTFKQKYLRRHMRRKHGGKQLKLRCKLCNYSTYNEFNLMYHVHTQTGEKLFKCKLCDYQNKNSSYFKTHVLKHSDAQPFCCDKCDYKTYNKWTMTQHKIIHSKEKPFKCSLCDYSCKWSNSLNMHMNKHSGEPNLSCDKCEYKAYSSSRLAEHKIVHSEKKPFKCNSCDFTTKYSTSLKIHLSKHSGELNLSCEKCDYKTYSNSMLARHKMVHSEEKSFKCNSCNFTTKYSTSLNVHLTKHSGERNLSCDKCDYKTYSRSTLVRHKKVHSEERSFKCNSCGFTTKHSSSLKLHLSKYSSEHNLSCDKCDYKTYCKLDVRNHQKIHLDLPYKCNSCDYRGRHLHDLKRHLNKHAATSVTLGRTPVRRWRVTKWCILKKVL